MIADVSRDPVRWTRELEAALRGQYAAELLPVDLNKGAVQMMQALAAKPSFGLMGMWAALLARIGNATAAAAVRALSDMMFPSTPQQPEPAIAIYTGFSGAYTGGNMTGPGVWGSELAAVKLAEALSRACPHLRVYVFCECLVFNDPPVPHNGVTYVPRQFYGVWQQHHLVRLLVVSRYLHFFIENDAFRPMTTVLWLHDKVPHYLTAAGALADTGLPFFKNLLCVPELRVACVSEWQRDELRVYAQVPLERELSVLGNGIDAALLMQQKRSKVPGRMIFCSDPSRGLGVLLDLFVRIKQAAPHAELHVYWSAANLKDTEGAVFKGKVSQPELFLALQEAQVLLYPNHAHETYCQVALEASAAGCHVIARDYSGLADTLRAVKCVTLIPGASVHDEAWQAAAVAKTLAVFAAGEPEVCVTPLPTWDVRAAEWRTWLDL